MTKPLKHPIAMLPDYREDGYGWAMAQAALLRARRFGEIDLANVIEEIESVGRSEQSAAESALRVLMMHILKWQAQPERRSRSWALSIAEQRLRYDRRMARNPGLKPLVDEMREHAYQRARINAAQETDLPLSSFPLKPPGWAMILDEPFDSEP